MTYRNTLQEVLKRMKKDAIKPFAEQCFYAPPGNGDTGFPARIPLYNNWVLGQSLSLLQRSIGEVFYSFNSVVASMQGYV